MTVITLWMWVRLGSICNISTLVCKTFSPVLGRLMVVGCCYCQQVTSWKNICSCSLPFWSLSNTGIHVYSCDWHKIHKWMQCKSSQQVLQNSMIVCITSYTLMLVQCRHIVRPMALWLEIEVNPALGNVHTNFLYILFCFWVSRPYTTQRGRQARPVMWPVRMAS